MSNEQLHRGIQEILVDYEPANAETLAQYAVDSVVPRTVAAPDSVETLSAVVRFAAQTGFTVVPRGSGTKMGIGRIPDRVDIVLLLERLNQVIEYSPADMTVTVQAGMRFSDLQAHLAQQGQFLPLDPPHADVCTVGGVLATDTSGALRWTYGTIRDLVTGTRVVQADGTIVKAGGKVVKNVAGYDMSKLYIGSLGTLGILTEATLRLRPIPETGQAVIGRFPYISTIMDTAFKVLNSNIMPSFLEVANPVPAAILARRAGGGIGDAGFPLIIGITGPAETVEWQMVEAEELCRETGAVQVIPVKNDLYRLTTELIQEFPTGRAVPHRMLPGIVCRATVVPEDIGQLYQLAEDRCQKRNIGCGMLSHFGNGAMTFVFFQDHPFEEERLDILASILEELISNATYSGGSFTIEHAPPALKERIDVWGPPRGDWALMKMIKERFDPGRVLNPGRFVGGI